ncbi:MAG: class I SAM-dependent methyltransferase [Pseudomonadota bacterium]|nr:class I SAM-dependent methyltransferase [Pseudomonadota bacterium]
MGLLERNAVLKTMYDTQTSADSSGPLHSNLPQSYAEALYGVVAKERPAVALEVGMAMGTSSLAMLTALQDIGGRLISIDPTQSTAWNGKGVAAVAKAGLSHLHDLVEDYDYAALPRLLADGTVLDFAYIDGWHTFDYTLLDWWYIDRMLKPGGIVAFNDCSWPAVDRAIRFVLTHRKYIEIHVGLPITLTPKGSHADRLLRTLTGKDPRRRVEDRYFRKTEHWEPSWDFYAQF